MTSATSSGYLGAFLGVFSRQSMWLTEMAYTHFGTRVTRGVSVSWTDLTLVPRTWQLLGACLWWKSHIRLVLVMNKSWFYCCLTILVSINGMFLFKALYGSCCLLWCILIVVVNRKCWWQATRGQSWSAWLSYGLFLSLVSWCFASLTDNSVCHCSTCWFKDCSSITERLLVNLWIWSDSTIILVSCQRHLYLVDQR